MSAAFSSGAFSVSAFSVDAFAFDTVATPPSGPWGRRFLHDGIAFDIDEDDEELLMMLAAAAPLLNRGNQWATPTASRG